MDSLTAKVSGHVISRKAGTPCFHFSVKLTLTSEVSFYGSKVVVRELTGSGGKVPDPRGM